jgi:hypothetical protein
MSKQAAVINLSPEEESTLRQCLRAGTTEQRMTERAQIVLLASQGQSTVQIAASFLPSKNQLLASAGQGTLARVSGACRTMATVLLLHRSV